MLRPFSSFATKIRHHLRTVSPGTTSETGGRPTSRSHRTLVFLVLSVGLLGILPLGPALLLFLSRRSFFAASSSRTLSKRWLFCTFGWVSHSLWANVPLFLLYPGPSKNLQKVIVLHLLLGLTSPAGHIPCSYRTLGPLRIFKSWSFCTFWWVSCPLLANVSLFYPGPSYPGPSKNLVAEQKLLVLNLLLGLASPIGLRPLVPTVLCCTALLESFCVPICFPKADKESNAHILMLYIAPKIVRCVVTIDWYPSTNTEAFMMYFNFISLLNV